MSASGGRPGPSGGRRGSGPEVHASQAPTDGLTCRSGGSRSTGTREARAESAARVRHLPRMPDVLQALRQLPSLFDIADRSHGATRARSRARRRARHGRLLPVQAVRSPVPVHAARRARLPARFRSSSTAGRPCAKRRGFSFRDRVLGDPDWTGRAGRASVSRNALARFRPTAGCSRRCSASTARRSSAFASTTFERWAEREGRIRDEPGGEAVLFPTCFVQNNEPELGTALRPQRTGSTSAAPRVLRAAACAGLERGDLAELRSRASRTLTRSVRTSNAARRSSRSTPPAR